MARPSKPGNGSDFPKLPDAEPIRVYISDARVQREQNRFRKQKPDGTFTGPAERDVVKVVMEATAPEFEGSRVWFGGGFSVHEKSNYRKLVIAAADMDPRDDEELLDIADTEALIGRQLVIIGEYRKKVDGSTSEYLTPTIFKRLPRDKWVPGGSPAPVKEEAVAAQAESAEDVSDF